jgi:hypothetical protein
MRQIFFLLVSAMFAAFSLSWASPGSGDKDYILPDQVILPMGSSIKKQFDVSAIVSLKDSCERIESAGQEVRGNKILFSIKVSHVSDSVCVQQIQPDISVNFPIEKPLLRDGQRIDIYFRQDEENLKYFGSIEVK